ncbi:MAG: glycosyltransferase family 4 protein [Blastocatellia bacterium]
MRVAFVVPSMRCGGAERILTVMANYWAEQGCKVMILTLDSEKVTPFYSLSSKVLLRSLDVLGESKCIFAGVTNNFRRIFILRKLIRANRPAVVISFLLRTNVRVLLATAGLGVPVIVSERSDPFLSQPGNVWHLLARLTYPLAQRITVFTKHAARYFPAPLKTKVRVIPNPVTPPAYQAVLQEKSYRIVAVGRLEYVKGFDLLLKAFAVVRQAYPTATLTIWGEGSNRQELELLRDTLGIAAAVFLPGITADVASALRNADLFVQTSRWEGFGNALCEAMAVGLPVISTACSGPQEIIHDGLDGRLVPVENVAALVNAILALFQDFSARQTLAHNASAITERFALSDIMKQWEMLVTEVTE